MNRKLQLALISFLLVCFLTSQAQPVLTATGINPVIGNTYTSNSTNFVAAGSAGANQTWDLTSMVSASTTTSTAVSPSTTPYAASFPTATVAYNSSGTYQ